MTTQEKVLYTGKTHTTGGREGFARSDDAQLDVRLSPPGGGKAGTNPEQLFAAGWSACFIGALGLAASKHKLTLPAETAVDAEVDLAKSDGGFSFRPGLPSACPASTRTLRDRSSPKRIRPAPTQRQPGEHRGRSDTRLTEFVIQGGFDEASHSRHTDIRRGCSALYL